MEYYYIVAAAGIGKRMGLEYPKQFLEVEGKPIFIKTLEVIEKSEIVTGIVIVTNKEYLKKVKRYCQEFKITKVKSIVQGGRERQDSIYNALLKVPKNCIVGVQDGVRPFIKKSYIENSYDKLMSKCEVDGIVVGVPVKDTIKIIDKATNFIEKTPIRNTLYAAQTPQVFRSEVLLRSYENAKKDGFLGTDDSSLVERLGVSIEFIEGSYDNIKVTTPEDLLFIENKK